MKKHGFTIIELMLVIAVISVLVTITVVAAKGAMASSRIKRRDLMTTALQQAIVAYNTQNGKWPDAIETWLNGNPLADNIIFSAGDSDAIFRQVVGVVFHGGTMLIDASALYVCEQSNADKEIIGIDFSEAANKGQKLVKGGRYIPLSNMSFGYQDPKTGHFRRFYVTYNRLTDMVSVTTTKPQTTDPEN